MDEQLGDAATKSQLESVELAVVDFRETGDPSSQTVIRTTSRMREGRVTESWTGLHYSK